MSTQNQFKKLIRSNGEILFEARTEKEPGKPTVVMVTISELIPGKIETGYVIFNHPDYVDISEDEFMHAYFKVAYETMFDEFLKD